MVRDDTWLAGEFLETLKKPLNTAKSPKGTPPLPGSFAVLTQLRDLWQGTSSEIYSLGVSSEGWYDLPQEIFFSFPVKFGQGSWKIVDNIPLDDSLKAQLLAIAEELKNDCEEILNKLSSVS